MKHKSRFLGHQVERVLGEAQKAREEVRRATAWGPRGAINRPFGADNEIVDRITYEVFRRADGSLDMSVTTELTNNDYGFPAALTSSRSS